MSGRPPPLPPAAWAAAFTMLPQWIPLPTTSFVAMQTKFTLSPPAAPKRTTPEPILSRTISAISRNSPMSDTGTDATTAVTSPTVN